MGGRHLVHATLLAIAVSTALGQGSAAILRGTVVSADASPVEGAEVAVSGSRQAVRSDSSGRFRVAGIEPGAHTVTIRKIGFAAHTIQLTFVAGDSSVRRFNLGAPQTLDSVRVSVARSGIQEFEDRRRSHIGYFLTREQLQRSAHRKLTDELRGVSGLGITENPQDRSEVWAMQARGRASIQANNSACFVQVYMDDTPVYSGPPQPPFNLGTVATADVEGVEFYAGGSSTPAKFNRTGSVCGVLVIWTRR